MLIKQAINSLKSTFRTFMVESRTAYLILDLVVSWLMIFNQVFQQKNPVIKIMKKMTGLKFTGPRSNQLISIDRNLPQPKKDHGLHKVLITRFSTSLPSHPAWMNADYVIFFCNSPQITKEIILLFKYMHDWVTKGRICNIFCLEHLKLWWNFNSKLRISVFTVWPLGQVQQELHIQHASSTTSHGLAPL